LGWGRGPFLNNSRPAHNLVRTFVSNLIRNMRIRTLILVPLAGLLAFVLLAAPRPAHAQSGDFTVSQNGKRVGTAAFHITPTPAGFDSTSVIHVDMQGLNYALSKNEDLSPSHGLLHVQLSATINGSAVNVTAKPDASQYLMNTSANGRSTTARLAFAHQAVFLPDFDPGAFQTLLALAAANNNRNLWAIIPKQAGSIAPIQLNTYPDEHGTLNGKAIDVHHLVATISGAVTDLFSGPDNQLMQAELPQQGFALVRNGFVLTPPAKPLAPPDPPQAPPTAPTQPSPQEQR
jgi:hypothetical protein